ncbi:MAG TPA: ATP-binding protein [Azospirillaceae bacterium]|nr:ATP-binding protein [Azospirillaceae bacterium]
MIALQGTMDDIARLEAALAAAGGADAPAAAELAWYLRDRDTVRAAALAQEALAHQAPHGDPDPALAARARLTLAHCAMARVDVREARSLMERALEAFRAGGDARGEADLRLVEADLAQALGDTGARLRCLEEAEPLYTAAGFEPGRADAAARRAHVLGQLGRIQEARTLAAASLETARALGDAGCQAFCLFVLGAVALERGEHGEAVGLLTQGLEAAQVEQLRFVEGLCQSTLAVACSRMADQAGYLYWLDQAQATYAFLGRTQHVAYVLNSLGFLYTQLGDHTQARDFLEEAQALLRHQENSRTYALNRRYAGDLALALGRDADAAESYRTGWLTAARLFQADLQITCLRGLGIALSRQGDVEGARDALEQALRLSEETESRVEGEIDCLRAMAEFHRTHGTPGSSPAVACLERALRVAQGMDGYRVRPELHEELAAAYEEAGDLPAALAQSREAMAAFRAIFNAEADARLRSLQARLDMDRVRAVADAEHRRAEELAAGARTIALLGEIGQRITASLEMEQVFETLRSNVMALLDAPVFGIALVRAGEGVIDFPYFVENGVRLGPMPLAIDHPTSVAAQSLREGREILIVEGERLDSAPMIAGTAGVRPRSVLFRPLVVGGRILGVMTCQSFRPDAYGAREVDIVRTLASYGAIALANAEAYQALDRALNELKDAQTRLVQQEKMAALGQLVAGIAHEVNTPVGIALSAATSLADGIGRIEAKLAGGALRRTDLEELLADGREAAGMIERNVRRASQLISSFKEVAVDQTSDQRRRFELGAYLEEIVTSLSPRIRRSGNKVEIDAAPGLAIDSYPGAIAQIVTNLVINAVDHAFGPERTGTIRLAARALPRDRVELTVADDGRGVPADALSRIFDPFFTTRRAAGNTGLGLHVAFNLANHLLGGGIRVESAEGAGTRFTVTLPRTAPVRTETSEQPEPALTDR